ncbi:MAG: PAS domain S-box protein [Deltaproteobacteria bacterium]|nr:PAS domain S-box protein [Deltaproteobacteria bacterium]
MISADNTGNEEKKQGNYGLLHKYSNYGLYPAVEAINSMSSESAQKEVRNSRLRWLMFYRVLVVSLFLGIAAVIQFKGAERFSPSLYSIYVIIGITYLFSILYVFLLKKIGGILKHVYIQSFMDIALITALVYVTGGIESIFATLYPIIIIYSALFLGGKGVILIASISSILYGLLLDLEFFGIIHPMYNMPHVYSQSPGYVFSQIFTHIASFYIIAILSIVFVSQEKKARVLLSEKESAFEQLDLLHRSIIESVGSGIMTADPEGIIRSFNRAAEEITGYSFDETKNRKIDFVFPDIYREMKKKKGLPDRFELTLSRSNEENKIVGFSLFPLIDPESKTIGDIFIFQDLTAIRGMEEEIERNKRLAFIGGMAPVLAHELRTPLVSIGGSIKLLQKDLKLDDTNKRLMDIILRGRDQLEDLANNFLFLARSGSSKRSTIDIGELFDDIIESIRLGADWNENIEIEKDISGIPDMYGSRVEIRQIFWNIILNALQSMPDGGKLTIHGRIIKGNDGNELQEVTISDTGFGIAKGNMKSLLEPFYTTKERGTGLGLAIVNKIIDAHGGKLSIESELNKGTRCTILLPTGKNTKP